MGRRKEEGYEMTQEGNGWTNGLTFLLQFGKDNRESACVYDKKWALLC